MNSLYYIVGSIIINIVKKFIKTNDNLILFVSYGGKQYSDSPKVIYEAMIEDERFNDYDLVWAFSNTNIKIPGNAKIIKIDTIEYFLTSLKARVWISNVPMERRLKYTGKNTFYFNTWHGTPIKKLGNEVSKVYGRSRYDVLCAQSELDVFIWQKAFNIKRENIKTIGLPRNDILVKSNIIDKIEIRKKLGIPLDKKVILYCPTFRDWKDNYMNDVVNFEKWEKVLGKSYLVLFRAHSMVLESHNINESSDFVYDVSDYHDVNDLMIASDMLVSDYSSIFFDYSILEKPMYCFTYDYEEYSKKRGVYFDIRNEIPGGSITEDELLNLIKGMPFDEVVSLVKEFKNKYIDWYGNATSKSLDIIYNQLKK